MSRLNVNTYPLSPEVQLSLKPTGGGKSVSVNAINLLIYADKVGSMSLAAKQTGHSFSALWSNKQKFSNALGCDLIQSSCGGARDTSFTPVGRVVCGAVADWAREVEAFAQRTWEVSVIPAIAAAMQSELNQIELKECR